METDVAEHDALKAICTLVVGLIILDIIEVIRELVLVFGMYTINIIYERSN